jgi:hypothetical protein
VGRSLHGILRSYADAKDIAIDVYKANFLQLSKESADLALSRAEELTDNFLGKLKLENESAMGSLKDPGMQSSLFEAQKEFAKTGDKDLEGLLIDILVERAGVNDRNLHQIVLDESLKVAPKLTTDQMDALTITVNGAVNSLETFKVLLERDFIPFIATLSKESSCYEHLEYAGCGSLNLLGGLKPVETIFKQHYSGLFCKGFEIADFESTVGASVDYQGLLSECLQDSSKFQINVLTELVLNDKMTELGIDDEHRLKLTAYFNNNLMSDLEVKEYILKIVPGFEILFDRWSDSNLSKFSLTTVGIAIAQANFRRRTGVKLQLSIWIK